MRPLLLRTKQLRQLKAKGVGYPTEVEEADIALASLNFAHVSTVDPSRISECLLGHLPGMAHRTKGRAELA